MVSEMLRPYARLTYRPSLLQAEGQVPAELHDSCEMKVRRYAIHMQRYSIMIDADRSRLRR